MIIIKPSFARLLFVVFFATLIFQCEDVQLFAQTSQRTWIFFSDKENISPSLLQKTSASHLGITERAIWRRSKVLPEHQLLDELDLPVREDFIQVLRRQGAEIRSVSRWFNAVSISGEKEALQSILQLPFVSRSEPVAVMKKDLPHIEQSVESIRPFQKSQQGHVPDYGLSFTQLNNIKVVDLHKLGVNGTGIIVGMVDDGFNNHRTHTAMKGIKVLAEYDFVHRDTNTSAEPGDYGYGSGLPEGWHGSLTLSALAGYDNGFLVGPAYGASLLLAKTEIDSVEIQLEEDLYVEGLEWMERLGADIVSSSLGYIDWYVYRNLDGKSAITSKAARILARKGVLLVTAAGNEGWYRTRNPDSTGTLIAPSDADSIIAAGATFSDGALASFSSTGPSFDGRTKPEVVAQGIAVRSASYSSLTGYMNANGTSLSTPLVAGSAAAILSAHPYLTPMQLRESLISTATQIRDNTSKSTTYPNNFYGWGMVNAYNAALSRGTVFSNNPRVVDYGSMLEIFTSIASNTPVLSDSIFIYYKSSQGGSFQRAKMTSTQTPNEYRVVIPASTDSVFPRGYFSAFNTTDGTRKSPYNAPESLFIFRSFVISVITPIIPETHILEQNYPNPFNSGTVIRFSLPRFEDVDITIYNLLGQKIRTLYNGFSIPGENPPLYWDGTDELGNRMPTGMYIYRLTTSTRTLDNKMILVR